MSPWKLVLFWLHVRVLSTNRYDDEMTSPRRRVDLLPQGISSLVAEPELPSSSEEQWIVPGRTMDRTGKVMYDAATGGAGDMD